MDFGGCFEGVSVVGRFDLHHGSRVVVLVVIADFHFGRDVLPQLIAVGGWGEDGNADSREQFQDHGFGWFRHIIVFGDELQTDVVDPCRDLDGSGQWGVVVPAGSGSGHSIAHIQCHILVAGSADHPGGGVDLVRAIIVVAVFVSEAFRCNRISCEDLDTRCTSGALNGNVDGFRASALSISVGCDGGQVMTASAQGAEFGGPDGAFATTVSFQFGHGLITRKQDNRVDIVFVFVHFDHDIDLVVGREYGTVSW